MEEQIISYPIGSPESVSEPRLPPPFQQRGFFHVMEIVKPIMGLSNIIVNMHSEYQGSSLVGDCFSSVTYSFVIKLNTAGAAIPP
jgi:hypothetical protein